MNPADKSEVSLNIKNSYASKYEIPIMDRTLSTEFRPEMSADQVPVSPIELAKSANQFPDANPAETSRFGGVAQNDSNSIETPNRNFENEVSRQQKQAAARE